MRFAVRGYADHWFLDPDPDPQDSDISAWVESMQDLESLCFGIDPILHPHELEMLKEQFYKWADLREIRGY